MSQQILLTTTGTPSSVIINDLGGRTFVHPVSGFDLLSEFKIEQIRDSDDLQTAINSGAITLTDDTLSSITNLKDNLENAKLRFDENRNNTVDNAAQLNGLSSTYYLDRTNHTGTQTASSISDFAQQVNIINLNSGTAGWALNGANAYLLNNQNSSFYLNRTNHTGTQVASTISDFYIAQLSGTSGYTFNAANAFQANNTALLNNQNAAFYLNRTNHTGTQTASTISDFNSSVLILGPSSTAGWATNTAHAFTADAATNSTQLNGQNAAFYLNRSNHTGTQLAATISDFNSAVLILGPSSTSGWATNAANAFQANNAALLNNQNAAFYLNRTNHTGTQLAATISDFNSAVLVLGPSSTAGWANNTANAFLLNNQNAAFYLNRTNHTGTQLAATISDFNSSVLALGASSTAGWANNTANAFLLNNQNAAFYLSRANHTGAINGDLFLNANLNVVGNLNLQGILYSTSGINTSSINMSGNLTTQQITATRLGVSGTINSNSSINTTSDVNASGKLYATSGIVSGAGISAINDFTTTTGSFTTTDGSFTTLNGNIQTTGGNITTSIGGLGGSYVAVTGNANIKGQVFTIGSLNTLGNVNVQGTLYATSGISTPGTMNVAGAATFNSTTNIAGQVFTIGNLNTLGNINLQGRLYATSGISTPGTLSVTGVSTFASNISSSAQVFAVGNLNTNTDVNASGKIYATSGFSTPGTLNVTGNTAFASNLNTSAQVFAVGDLNSNGDANITGRVFATSGFSTPSNFNTTAGVYQINGTDVVNVAQTFTNKTITATTNNVAANSVKNTTGVVDVAASAAPSAGQFLIATSATTATWQNIVNNSVGVTSTLNVTATSYATGINGSLTLTPASGTYLVMWSASVTIGTAAATVNGAIHVAGTINANSERRFKMASGNQGSGIVAVIGSQAIVTVNGSQAIEARFIVSTGTGVLSFRSMVIIKIA